MGITGRLQAGTAGIPSRFTYILANATFLWYVEYRYL
jgi:hypothetical protein